MSQLHLPVPLQHSSAKQHSGTRPQPTPAFLALSSQQVHRTTTEPPSCQTRHPSDACSLTPCSLISHHTSSASVPNYHASGTSGTTHSCIHTQSYSFWAPPRIPHIPHHYARATDTSRQSARCFICHSGSAVNVPYISMPGDVLVLIMPAGLLRQLLLQPS